MRGLPLQPPITTSWPPRHLALMPGFGAAGLVWRAGALGDDAFEIELAGRLQHGIAWLGEMLDVFDLAAVRPFAAPAASLSRSLRSVSGRRAQILAVLEQQVEDEIHQILRASFGERRLQGGRNPARRCGRAHTTSPSMMQSGRPAAGLRDRGELRRPVEPLARAHDGLAVLDAQLHAIAVELDLVHPVLPRGRAAHALAELRRR